jgi:Galactose oxidase, central domain/Kelch motif
VNYEGSIPNPRYGHTATLYQRKLYLYGGKTKTSTYSFLPDFEIFNMENQNFTVPYVSGKKLCCSRRNHIAELIGNSIFIHGGMNEDNITLRDYYLYSILSCKWQIINTKNDSASPTISGHTSCLVVSSEIRYNQKFNIYKFPEEKNKKLYNKVRRV